MGPPNPCFLAGSLGLRRRMVEALLKAARALDAKAGRKSAHGAPSDAWEMPSAPSRLIRLLMGPECLRDWGMNS